MLEIRHLKKAYEKSTPLKDISFTVMPGEVISIIGPSGTGKSTLLRCINGLETPTSGEIIYNGQDILAPATDRSEIRKHIGMVFQSFNLFPHLTVLQNVMVPQIDLLGRSKQEAYEKAYSLLKQVGLAEQARQYPDTLSGGQKQRVAIARTLAMDNDIILLDEPTSALDPAMVGEVESVIQSLTKTGITMLIVTHEMRFAKAVSSRILFINNGVIAEDGTPQQIFEHPVNECTRRFIFRIHEFSVDIKTDTFDFYSCLTDINRFAERNYLSPAMTEKVKAVFEELIAINLMQNMKEGDQIHVDLTCSEMTEELVMKVSYTQSIDPDKDIDPISMSIIRHRSDEFSFAPADGENALNTITVTFRKD